MGVKKLDKWADLLLDTGKRNNLINFKDSKASTVEVLLPAADALFEKIGESVSFEVFDPRDVEEDDESEQKQIEESEQSEISKKAAFFSKYSGKIKRRQILLYNAATHPVAALKNVDKKARSFIEETGVNVAYMAFGFIHWKESDFPDVFRAPILLVPIQIKQDFIAASYFIDFTEEDIIVNPTFSYKLDAEYGMRLPDYNDEGLTAYLGKVKDIVKRLQWTVTAECKIGIFSFLKINMYRDLKDNAALILKNKNIRILLGESIDAEQISEDEKAFKPDKNPLIDLHSVTDADSSQIDAIEFAKSGKSFVLQGPPGTGKSQTITNIIAECLSDGKKILFVSEKLAALNIVYRNLNKAGLSDFCLQLHSHKAKKQTVIADICQTLRTKKSVVSSKAEDEIAVKRKTQKQLDAYDSELHAIRPVIGKSLYHLYEAYSAFRSMPDVKLPFAQIASKDETYLLETTLLLEQYADYIPSVGRDYKKNVWYGYINQDTSYETKTAVKSDLVAASQILQASISLQQKISENYGVQCAYVEDMRFWNEFFDFAATSQIITPSLLKKETFDTASSALKELQALSSDILYSRSILNAAFDNRIYELDGTAYHKKLTKQFSNLFSRLFNGEYKRIVNDMRSLKKNGKRVSYLEAVATANRLSHCQRKNMKFVATEEPIKAFLGSAYKGIETEWDYVTEQMSTLGIMLSKGISFGKLESYSDFASERKTFADYAEKLKELLIPENYELFKRIAGCFDSAILNVLSMPCSSLSMRLNGCLNEIDKLDNWCYFRDLLSKLNDKQAMPFIDAAIEQNIDPTQIAGAFKKHFYRLWIDSILSETPTLSAFNRISQDKAVNVFSAQDIEQFEINKAKIRAELSAKRPSLDLIVPKSPLAILLREGEKKRKQKSIRTLLSETGELVQRVKPCFLMSPLSVSTFLEAGSVSFDVVIFDEASQIFPQDAVGAIYRAKQIIVVGDSKQMPPSNFFNASVEVEDNDNEDEDVTGFESILDLCSASFKQLRLRWHYRSRYEQLIAFSNKNFYDRDLITFPSPKSAEHGFGIDYYHVDGIFDRKSHTNQKEAEFIVDLIYRNKEKYPERSLGIIAFSVAQQNLIDKLLSERLQESPDKERFFKNDNDESFFIKNLETVQGDERDTIIFSVAYGIDTQGRLLHNFGPINRLGGERRLNVAFTRAKYNVQLVSSMHYTDIDLNKTSSKGARLLREYLDLAENGNIALERTVSTSVFDRFDSDFELEVCDFLRSNGFTVDTKIGCSGCKIDLALKFPDSSDYILAIECDGDVYHSFKNARDRDRLRKEVLERMGWKFYRIWSTDWFRNKSVEQQQLLEAANDAIDSFEPEKNAAQTQTELTDNPVPETFEEIASEEKFEFPPYKTADVDKIFQKYQFNDFKALVKEILEIEAPLSENLLRKRLEWYFIRRRLEFFNGAISLKTIYEYEMLGYRSYGIVRKNGFLYLDNGKEIRFRRSGDIERNIKQIAPEELAAGMLDILKNNRTADKNELYHLLARQCGITRIAKTVKEAMDSAFCTLDNVVITKGEQISLR